MFGQSRPVTFNPYGRRRSRWRLPRWLVLLLIGIAAGAAGIVVFQERYLPPRLSADASAALQHDYEEADGERQRLRREMSELSRRLQLAQAERKDALDESSTGKSLTDRLREDLGAVVAALPPDPRGGAVEVRAAQFAVKGGQLAYDVVLTRDKGGAKPMPAAVQFVVTGDSSRGAETNVTLKPISLQIGAYEVARGNIALPDGLKPRQVTVQVMDRPGGRSLGMRVLLVK